MNRLLWVGVASVMWALIGCDEGAVDASTSEGLTVDTYTPLDTLGGQDPGSVFYETCEVTQIRGAELTERRYGCSRARGVLPWQCQCAGAPVADVSAASCEAAISSACEVPASPAWCRGQGTCWSPSFDGSFDCACHDGRQLIGATGPCEDAVFDGCATPCAHEGQGACEVDADARAYACTCDDGRTLDVSDAATCSAALGRICEPACQTATSVCYGAPDEASFDCFCEGGTEAVNVQHSERSGLDPCQALVLACGGDLGEPRDCARASSDGATEGRCQISPTGAFSCSCSGPGGESANAGSSSPDADCEADLLYVYCPAAFE